MVELHLRILVLAVSFVIGGIWAHKKVEKKNKPHEEKKAVKAKSVNSRNLWGNKAVSFAVEYEDGSSGIEEVMDYQDRFKELSLLTLHDEREMVNRPQETTRPAPAQVYSCPRCQATVHFGDLKCQCGQVFDWTKI